METDGTARSELGRRSLGVNRRKNHRKTHGQTPTTHHCIWTNQSVTASVSNHRTCLWPRVLDMFQSILLFQLTFLAQICQALNPPCRTSGSGRSNGGSGGGCSRWFRLRSPRRPVFDVLVPDHGEPFGTARTDGRETEFRAGGSVWGGSPNWQSQTGRVWG